MTKYLVHLNPGMSQVIISLDGYGPTKGENLKELGSFELDIDPNDAQVLATGNIDRKGDHPFIVEARKVLQEHLGDHNSTNGYTYLDRATNAVPDLDPNADMSTDAMDAVEGDNRHSEASTQPGGEQNSQTGEHRAGEQEAGQETDTPPATQAATGESNQTDHTDETQGSDGKESVAKLKERIATITDKDELQKVYDDEVAGENRSTAKAAIEARAAELEAA
jgi:hypothetical protein